MVCFVILHYQNLKVTYQCISYLKKLKRIEEAKILIVDNGSSNYSGLELQDMYKNDAYIEVIISERNLGFASGNNLGYREAKEKYNAKCIVAMNSDIYITDNAFLEKLYKSIKENPMTAIVAPDILNLNDVHCNPMIYPPISESSIKKIYRDSLMRYYLYSVPILNKKLWKRANSKSVQPKLDRDGWNKKQVDIVPDGSCIIFFPYWVQREDIAFVPITFMYAEEHILYEYLSVKKYISVYDPVLQVHHMEGATTGELTKIDINQGIKNKKRNLRWHYESCKVYLNYKKRLHDKDR